MDFEYTLEQEQLIGALRRFLTKKQKFSIHIDEDIGSDENENIWHEFAELGLLALALPGEHGGFDGKLVDLMTIMEVMGEAVLSEPYLSTVALGASFLIAGGTSEQQGRWLPEIAAGRCCVAFAHLEKGARHNLKHCTTVAISKNGNWIITGKKSAVLHADRADLFIVVARTDGSLGDAEGLSLFLIAPDTHGMTQYSYTAPDGLPAADLVFDNVILSTDALIGRAGSSWALIEKIYDRATILQCAEAVGMLRRAFQLTLDYLKVRKQFGQAIGGFQALQHRMVELFIDLEQVYSIVCLVCAKLDEGVSREEERHLVSAAKIRVNDACLRSSQETVQMHGAIGLSNEMMISFIFRRLTMIIQRFGDSDHHLGRFSS